MMAPQTTAPVDVKTELVCGEPKPSQSSDGV